MQNTEAETIQDSTTNRPPRPAQENATNTPNHETRDLSKDDESPQPHSSDATNAPPPTQMRAPRQPPPPPPLPPPQPPFFQPMAMLPHPPHYIPQYNHPPYLNYQHFLPYGYPMIFPTNPAGPNMCMEKRSWSTGLFDCFSDFKNSFITIFCPCVTFGQVSEILNEGQTPWWEGAINYLVFEIATVATGTFVFAWAYRNKMRKKHLLKGSLFWDLIVSCFCTRLSLCQIYRQLDRLGYNVPLGWNANKDQRAMQNYRFQVVPPVVEPGMFR